MRYGRLQGTLPGDPNSYPAFEINNDPRPVETLDYAWFENRIPALARASPKELYRRGICGGLGSSFDGSTGRATDNRWRLSYPRLQLLVELSFDAVGDHRGALFRVPLMCGLICE